MLRVMKGEKWKECMQGSGELDRYFETRRLRVKIGDLKGLRVMKSGKWKEFIEGSGEKSGYVETGRCRVSVAY